MALSVREAEWHAQRREGIGASDIPAIAGVSTYATPIDVWQQKLGMVEPNPETPLTRWGHLLEPVIADEFTVQTGIKVRRLARAVKYRDWPILFAHLDRTAGDSILECKSSMSTKGWTENEIPDAVQLQVQGQLAAAGKERAYVAALIGYRDFRVYSIARDREMFNDLILPLLREFWQLVETETPPEPDGSEGYGAFVRRRFPTDAGDERAATPEEHLIGVALAEATAEKDRAEARESELKQRLMAAMGTTTKLDGPGWRATWRQSKDRTSVAWELVAKAYRAEYDDLRAQVAKVGKTARRVDPDTVAVDDDDFAWLETVADRDRAGEIESIYTEVKPGTRPLLFKVTEGE